MEEIKNSSEYKSIFKSFLLDSKDKTDKSLNDILKKTLEQALEVRKFEIELYWKRATYFWAFIAASFAGYFALLSSKNIHLHKPILLVVSLIGLLFSIGWYLVNRGSKYWQKNWEVHVSMLEDEIIGPLYKTMLNPRKYKFSNLLSEYPFSVSKINQILSLFMVLIWIYIIIFSINYNFTIPLSKKYNDILNIAYFSVVLFFSLLQFFRHAESSNSRDIKSKLLEKEAKLILRKEEE